MNLTISKFQHFAMMHPKGYVNAASGNLEMKLLLFKPNVQLLNMPIVCVP